MPVQQTPSTTSSNTQKDSSILLDIPFDPVLLEDILNAEVPWYTLYFKDGSVIFSWAEPVAQKPPSAEKNPAHADHIDLTYWQEKERCLFASIDNPEVEEGTIKVRDLPDWAFKYFSIIQYPEETVLIWNDNEGEYPIPKHWNTDELLEEFFTVPCYVTTKTELEYD